MIAGATEGDIIIIKMSDNSFKFVKLKEIKTFGLEGYDTRILGNPLKFYPYHNILEITIDK